MRVSWTANARAFFSGRASEGGQAIVLIAISLMAMLMVVGLSIDAGTLYSARRAMQEAADAGAYAATVALYNGGMQADAFAAAKADVNRNGYKDVVDGGDATITIRQPLTAPYNTAEYVEVIITRDVRTPLVPGQSSMTTVTVRAISGAESLNNKYAMIALDRNPTNNAFQSGSTAQISLKGGGILVNSSGSTAANSSTPNANWLINCTASNPCQIDVAGGATGTFPPADPTKYYNGLFTGKPPQADPFAGYPKPSTTGMLLNPAGFGTGGKTLTSGIYTSAISNVKLCSGIYVLKAGTSGSLDTDTSTPNPYNANVPCDGKVLIFNTLTNYPNTGGTCGPISVAGNNEINSLRPMTTGVYAGMLIYQDPACTAAMTLAGSNAEMDVTGTIYLPNAAFQLTGHAEVQGGQIVAKTISLGNGQVGLDFNSTTSARPILPRLAK